MTREGKPPSACSQYIYENAGLVERYLDTVTTNKVGIIANAGEQARCSDASSLRKQQKYVGEKGREREREVKEKRKIRGAKKRGRERERQKK